MKEMLVIAVHGKGSTAETSNTVQTLKKYFQDEADVITPTYSDTDPYEKTKKYFDSFVKSYSQYHTVAVIGASLGGFWAKYLANRIAGAKYVGLNPSLNFYKTGIEKDKPDLPITIYVAKDDNVVDPKVAMNFYRTRGDVKTLDSGGHRLSEVLPKLLPKIKVDIMRIH
jgi:dienelactone hydrolase